MTEEQQPESGPAHAFPGKGTSLQTIVSIVSILFGAGGVGTVWVASRGKLHEIEAQKAQCTERSDELVAKVVSLEKTNLQISADNQELKRKIDGIQEFITKQTKGGEQVTTSSTTIRDSDCVAVGGSSLGNCGPALSPEALKTILDMLREQ